MPDQSDATVLSAEGFLPTSVIPIPQDCNAQYEFCAAETQASWAYLCPPAMLTPGTRTGTNRAGSDVPMINAQGGCEISMEDFAVALFDEAEVPQHTMARFTVAH
ncbi:MAG: hypothetical protein HKN05_08800 [Rhizobiales bacterium]|nr:hypothetical protein [Hyphomicrobiales bacterium]